MKDLSNLIMPVAIGLIMFGIGLELCFKDFKRVFTHPKAILTGLACQVIMLPFLAFLLVYFWPIDPMYKVGIMIIAACPGGTSSNVVSKMLNGNIALAISLTAFNSFIILFTIPMVIDLSYNFFARDGHNISLGFWVTMKQVLYTVVIPVMAGVIVSESVSEKIRKKFHKPLKYILPVILLSSFIFVIFIDDSTRNINYLNKFYLFVPLIILNLATILSGFIIGKWMDLSHQDSYTISIEIGLQNSVLALYIGNELLQNEKAGLIAILYSSFTFVSTFLIAYLLKKTGKGKNSTST